MFERIPIAPSLPAADLERAKRWYAEKLGLTPTSELPGGAGVLYPAGGNPMGFLVYPSEFAGTAKNTAAMWAVEDVKATVAELRSRGVVFEEYEQTEYRTDQGISGDEIQGYAAWFKDSEGNILSVAQLPAGAEMAGVGASRSGAAS